MSKYYFQADNPEIAEQEGEQLDIEGCLSIPGITGEVICLNRAKVKAIKQEVAGMFSSIGLL